MTIHVNIGEAKTRLSELVTAALRGEDVVLQRAGEPAVRLVALPDAVAAARKARAAKRTAAIGFARGKYAHLPAQAFGPQASMTDEEFEERYRRKFVAPAA